MDIKSKYPVEIQKEFAKVIKQFSKTIQDILASNELKIILKLDTSEFTKDIIALFSNAMNDLNPNSQNYFKRIQALFSISYSLEKMANVLAVLPNVHQAFTANIISKGIKGIENPKIDLYMRISKMILVTYFKESKYDQIAAFLSTFVSEFMLQEQMVKSTKHKCPFFDKKYALDDIDQILKEKKLGYK